jgi:hypothetical protein
MISFLLPISDFEERSMRLAAPPEASGAQNADMQRASEEK